VRSGGEEETLDVVSFTGGDVGQKTLTCHQRKLHLERLAGGGRLGEAELAAVGRAEEGEAKPGRPSGFGPHQHQATGVGQEAPRKRRGGEAFPTILRRQPPQGRVLTEVPGTADDVHGVGGDHELVDGHRCPVGKWHRSPSLARGVSDPHFADRLAMTAPVPASGDESIPGEDDLVELVPIRSVLRDRRFRQLPPGPAAVIGVPDRVGSGVPVPLGPADGYQATPGGDHIEHLGALERAAGGAVDQPLSTDDGGGPAPAGRGGGGVLPSGWPDR
jgi:hypothetical protein